MKNQDIIFWLIFLYIVLQSKYKLSIFLALLCLLLSVILFVCTILFTAERLTWYAGAFILYSVVFTLLKSKKNENRN